MGQGNDRQVNWAYAFSPEKTELPHAQGDAAPEWQSYEEGGGVGIRVVVVVDCDGANVADKGVAGSQGQAEVNEVVYFRQRRGQELLNGRRCS